MVFADAGSAVASRLAATMAAKMVFPTTVFTFMLLPRRWAPSNRDGSSPARAAVPPIAAGTGIVLVPSPLVLTIKANFSANFLVGLAHNKTITRPGLLTTQ